MSYRAYLVDFDGTLYHARPVQICMAVELVLSGLSAVPILRRFRKSHEQLRQGLLPAHKFTEQQSPFDRQVSVTAADLDIPEAKVRQTVEQWMMCKPRKWIRLFRRQSLIRELVAHKQRGAKLALVSDYPLALKMKSLAHDVTFDAVVASGEAHGPTRLKPSPEGYLKAAATLGVEPHECQVIGDRSDADGLAASAAGMAFRLVR
jgi:HAD superfamily hydrolase (TIGR01549 family)